MFIFFLTPLFIQGALAAINVIDTGLVPLWENSVGLQFYADIENDDRGVTCAVQTGRKRCCLTDAEAEDCEAMPVYGPSRALVSPRDKQTLIFVYPTLFQHDLIGYCDFTITQRCGREKNKKKVIRIEFDTTLTAYGNAQNLLKYYIGKRRTRQCSFFDEDPLKGCDPVDCNQKYSGKRPYFDEQSSKCMPIIKCICAIVDDLPDVALVPKSNICRNLNKAFTADDIAEINRGFAVTMSTAPYADTYTEAGVKLVLTSNCSTISQNLKFLKDLIMGKFTSISHLDRSDYNDCLKLGFEKILMDIMKVSVCIVLFVLLLICASWLQPDVLSSKLRNLRERLSNFFYNPPKYKVSHINCSVKNSLLREVLIRDIPLELRDSAVTICTKMNAETRSNRRYRQADIGSQVSLQTASSDESSDCDHNETSKLLH